MTIDGLLMYLSSSEGSIFNPAMQRLYQDMSQPLCHYFISSSHNTYLLEDQLRGHSSVEGYIRLHTAAHSAYEDQLFHSVTFFILYNVCVCVRALKRGCRCVEVDCWDGQNGEPIVYHGHTLTSKILFKDVIIVLGNYAFIVRQRHFSLSLCRIPVHSK